MDHADSGYGLWGLVFLNSAIFVGFAYSFFKPATLRDWRSFSAYSAFIVALFAEMYGFPLTIYLFSGWLGSKFPDVDLFGHDAGHLWWLFTGQHGNPHTGVLHILSYVALFAGFALLSNAWHVLYHAQRLHELATAGPYRSVRHPRYIGFVASMFGFSAAVADAVDPRDVPGPGVHVRPARIGGRARLRASVRQRLGCLRGSHAALHTRLARGPASTCVTRI